MNRMSTSGREKQAERERARIATQRSAEPIKETEGILRLASDFLPDTYVVTHADYRALEEELAALRTVEGQWEISHRLVCKELESLRGKVSELVEADIALDLAKEKFTYAKGARERRQAALEALK